jgi:hypothetical protein
VIFTTAPVISCIPTADELIAAPETFTFCLSHVICWVFTPSFASFVAAHCNLRRRRLDLLAADDLDLFAVDC